MKRNVLIFGTISGLIPSLWILFAVAGMSLSMDYGMLLGYASMIVGNIFVIVGVKNYRDKYNGGVITFGKAFTVGLLIMLLASTIYVITWLIYVNTSGFDFMAHYSAMIQKDLEASGASAAEISKQMTEMKEFAVMYKNPFVNALFTYMEIIPVGLLFALITAFVMKRKVPKEQVA